MNNKMKELLALMLVVVTVFALAGCGKKDSPTTAVETALNELKESEITDTLLDTSQANLSDDVKKSYKEFMEKLHEFDYEIVKESISDDGDSATVEVKITTYSFGNAYLNSYEEIIEKHEVSEITGDILYGNLFKNMSELEDKNFTKTVTIDCKKPDDKWTAELNGNRAFQNAIFGDLIEILTELAQ